MGIKEFAEKLSADSAFAENYSGLEDAAAVVEQAIKDGYTITAEEVTELANGMISDEELDGVTGGESFASRKEQGMDIKMKMELNGVTGEDNVKLSNNQGVGILNMRPRNKLI